MKYIFLCRELTNSKACFSLPSWLVMSFPWELKVSNIILSFYVSWCLPWSHRFLFLPLLFSQIALPVQLKFLRGVERCREGEALLLLPTISWKMSVLQRQMERRWHISVPASWEWAAVYVGDRSRFCSCFSLSEAWPYPRPGVVWVTSASLW